MSDDNLLTVRLSPHSLDDISLGILRLSLDDRIAYLNRAAAELAGPGIAVGAPLAAVPFADESTHTLSTEIAERRRTGRGSNYPIVVERADERRRLRLTVSAVPEYDGAGRMAGSIAFINDQTVQDAQVALHEAIGSASDWHALLQALEKHLREVLYFDSIMVTLISADRSALRVFYEAPERIDASPAWRWWPMPTFVRADIDTLIATRPDDVRAMFESPPYRDLASDPETRAWLDLGYTHMLRRPVMRNGQLDAIVSLFRRDERAFSVLDCARLDQLPLVEAVNMALALDHQKELAFGLDLIARMRKAAANVADVARVLVDGLHGNYLWEHVSLFRVDPDEDTISLVYQPPDAAGRLPENYSQSMRRGLLGHVACSGQPVREGDVRTSTVYVEGIAGTMSEMCLPVPGRPVRWILNVESRLRSAFSAEDQASLKQILAVAGLILDRTLALEFNTAVLESVADAVIQTTSRGEIVSVNPACVNLLDRPLETLIGASLAALISAPGNEPDPPGYAARLVAHEKLAPTEVELLPREGAPIPVLLSAGSLPPQLGGKFYVASDLRYRQAVQQMGALQHVFQQVASETRLPLALLAGYLEELADRRPDANAARQTLDKAMRQLQRADLPLERIVRLAAVEQGQTLPLQPISLAEVAEHVHAALPQAQGAEVRIEGDGTEALVLAARRELEFCAESAVSFLLRMKAPHDRIRIRVGREYAEEVFAAELTAGDTPAPSKTQLVAKSEHERDFALAAPVMRGLMRRMKGSFDFDQSEGLRLQLRLPALENA